MEAPEQDAQHLTCLPLTRTTPDSHTSHPRKEISLPLSREQRLREFKQHVESTPETANRTEIQSRINLTPEP